MRSTIVSSFSQTFQIQRQFQFAPGKRHRIPVIQIKGFLTVLTAFVMAYLTGCGSSCGTHLASPMTGSNGLAVALSGVPNDAAVLCSGLSGGSTCSFTV